MCDNTLSYCRLRCVVALQHGVNQWSFFRIFEIIILFFVVAICDLVHVVEAMYGLP